MSLDTFYKLAPFIREYVYREKWERLREVQTRAIDAILDGPNHVLICSATASGKTEAALLPIITLLDYDPPSTIGALYIGPLKALINDQFLRISGLLEDSDIPVQSWHGDVAQSKKQRFLKHARGILQITPESLEAMLMNRHHELERLFGDLRYVIIDEVHAFIDSDRGRQVMCQLERLSRVQPAPVRRIGLSATLGEPEIARTWLRGKPYLDATTIQVSEDSIIELALEYFLFPDDSEEESAAGVTPENDRDDPLGAVEALAVDKDQYFRHLHSITQRVPKTLIFANSREAIETIGLNLRRVSELEGLPSFYHVHHGNISAPLREAAEEAMKEEDRPACVAATVTLELGIDLGQLDQVLQVDSTHSVSSFVQRLGRSGRRENEPSRMFFYCTEQQSDARHFGNEIPWNLLQAIAIVQLYLEEKWIESPAISRLPLSLLYHQTMSIIYSHTELSPPNLAERVLTLSPFEHVSTDQFRQLLRHLLEIEHLQQTETDDLFIGIGAERIVNNYRFYAVFASEKEYRVRDKSREIGTIQAPPEVDSTILLAGYVWRVLSVDRERRVIEVERAKGEKRQRWRGNGIEIHTRILQKMREILFANEDFIYVHDRAQKRLAIARQATQRSDLAASSILPLADNRFLLFPWSGTRPFNTLVHMLDHGGLKVVYSYEPYYLEVHAKCDTVNDLKRQLVQLCQNPPSVVELSKQVDNHALMSNKYDRYIPVSLLREAYSLDYLDIPGAIESIRRL